MNSRVVSAWFPQGRGKATAVYTVGSTSAGLLLTAAVLDYGQFLAGGRCLSASALSGSAVCAGVVALLPRTA